MENISVRYPYRNGLLFACLIAAVLAMTAGNASAEGTIAVPAEMKKAAETAAPKYSLNINTATKEQLDALPGVGPETAQAIIDHRPYEKTEDLLKVKGIDPKLFSQIKGLITVR